MAHSVVEHYNETEIEKLTGLSKGEIRFCAQRLGLFNALAIKAEPVTAPKDKHSYSDNTYDACETFNFDDLCIFRKIAELKGQNINIRKGIKIFQPLTHKLATLSKFKESKFKETNTLSKTTLAEVQIESDRHQQLQLKWRGNIFDAKSGQTAFNFLNNNNITNPGDETLPDNVVSMNEFHQKMSAEHSDTSANVQSSAYSSDALNQQKQVFIERLQNPFDAIFNNAKKGILDNQDNSHNLSTEALFFDAIAIEPNAPDVAQKLYESILSLDPEHLDARINLVCLLIKKGQLIRAASHCRVSIAINDENPLPHYNLGLIRHHQGHYEDAVEHYKDALLYDPYFKDAHHNLSMALGIIGDKKNASKHLKFYEDLS